MAGELRIQRQAAPIEFLEPRMLLCNEHAYLQQDTLPTAGPPSAASEQALPPAASGPAGAGLLVPGYSSRPSSPHKLYLDFDGDYRLYWGGWFIFDRKIVGTTPAYDIDSDPANFSPTELENIRLIWQKTASLFSMFDLDVTTIDPGSLDDGVACKVVVGGNGSWLGHGGGVAQLNGFWDFRESVAFVWRGQNNPRDCAEAVAHEAGHMFGLKHQSISAPGSVAVEYRGGYIMGGGGSDEYGAYWGTGSASAYDSYDGSLDYSGIQNDYEILDNLGVVPDDHGNSIATASTMTLAGEGYINKGVIESESDSDFFRINVVPGTPLTIRAISGLPDPMGPMLDIAMNVFNSSGTLLAIYDNPGRNETFSQVAATDSTFYVSIHSGLTPAAIFNVGSYSLQVVKGIAGDDGPSTARRVFAFGTPYTPTSDRDNRLLDGRSTYLDNIGSGDAYDWYAMPLRGAANYKFLMNGLSADADLLLVGDMDGDGDFDLTGEDVLASSTNGGTLSESINYDARSAYQRQAYLVVRYNSTEGDTPYSLRVTVDRAENSASSYPRAFPFVFTSSVANVSNSDFVEPLNSDAYRWVSADSFGTGIVRRMSAVRIEVSEILQPVRLSVGYDLDFSRTLDPSEILSFVDGSPASPPVIDGISCFDDLRNPLMALVTTTAPAGTNYILNIDFNRFPSGMANLNDLSLADNGVGSLPSRNGFEFMSIARGGTTGNDSTTLDLGVPPAGPVQIETDFPDPSSNLPLPSVIELIRDANGNRYADPDEIVATGAAISTTIPGGNSASYFLRIRGDANSQQRYGFKTLVRNALVLNPTGTTMSQPIILQQGQGGFYEGFVSGLQDNTLLNREVNFHRFTLTGPQSLNASVMPSIMISGQPQPNDVNLAVVRDANSNGLLDADEWITGLKGNGRTGSFVSATLSQGTYFLAVMASPYERQTTTLQMDYRLNYFFDEVFDAVAPTVANTSLQYEQATIGLQVAFSEDVSQSLSMDDYVIESLSPGVASPNPPGQGYDEQTNTLYVPLDHRLPDGNYRLKILGGKIRDASGNLMTGDYVGNAFFILNGDANRDRTVNTLDFNLLAGSFGGSGKVFSQGDFSYSGSVDSVDFGILASQYGKTLPVAAPPVASTPAGTASAAPLFGEIGVTETDEVLDPLLT